VIEGFAGFSVMMAASSGLGMAGAVLPLLINTALVGLEILIAFIQAYVFAVLTCMYLKDAIELH